MRYAYAFVFLLLTVAIGAAASFSVSINSIDGARGRMVSDGQELDIGNCNMPQASQDTIMILKMSYPSTCNGLMDVYYSYYDFTSGTYTQEELACIISSTDNCRVTFRIWFGGKGDGVVMQEPWAKFRAVCRKSKAESTYNLPLKIVHTETLFEKQLLPKVIAAEQGVSAARQSLQACTCCADKEYVQTVKEYEMQLAALKERVSNCDFANIDNAFLELKKSADVTRAEIEGVNCGAKPYENKITETEEDTKAEVGTEGASAGVEAYGAGASSQGVGTGTGQQSGGEQKGMPCPAGALLLAAVCGLALARPMP